MALLNFTAKIAIPDIQIKSENELSPRASRFPVIAQATQAQISSSSPVIIIKKINIPDFSIRSSATSSSNGLFPGSPLPNGGGRGVPCRVLG